MKRVVMAVNNPGSHDYRVVKSAEVLAEAGYEVVVVGLARAGHAARETRNGVRYVRVTLPTSRLALVPDLIAGGTLAWQKLRPPRPVPTTDSAPPAAGAGSTPAAPSRGLRVALVRWLRACFKDFRPATSPFSVRLLFARYAHAYVPALLALEADVYHAHELWMLESCALAARARGTPLVYDSHELEPHRNLDWCDASNARRVAYEQRYIGDAAAVFTVSPGVARALEQIYRLPKVGLLRNTPWLAKLRAAPRGLRVALALDARTPLVVYTGLVTRHRGLELMLEALARLPDFHLAMVGPSEPLLAAALRAQAETLGVAARVHAVSPVPPEELIDFIASADVAVISLPDACLSYRYALPNKLFEALFAGLPLVVSELDDMARFVTEHELGRVFAQGDVSALAAALTEVHAHRDAYVDRARRAALCQDLSFENEAQALRECYAELTRDADATRPLPG